MATPFSAAQLLRGAVCFLVLLGSIFPHAIHEIFLCKNCGYNVVASNEIVNVTSPLSLRQRVGTLMGVTGVLLQRFRNPQGAEFDVITVANANVTLVSQPELHDTWFPGFTWSIAVCPQCNHHLGWFFESSNQTFYGLILSHLVHQSFADSILSLPNSQPFPAQTI